MQSAIDVMATQRPVKDRARQVQVSALLRRDDEATITAALEIVASRMRILGIKLESPECVTRYLKIRLGAQEHESFVVMFLDVKNRLIAVDDMFRGTLTFTSVYPREVVKAALARNAAGVILAHNHPSGESDPSDADLHLTRTIVQALALVDVRVLDHIIVAGQQHYSFAEHGHI